MKRIFALLIPAALFVAAGCSQKSDEAAEKPVPVKIYSVQPEIISEYIRATGSVEGDRDVILFAKVSEHVERIYAVPGQQVKKDEVLLVQKNDMLRQSMEIATAGVKSAEAQTALAVSEFERMSRLYSEKAVSPQQYEQARAARDAAEQGLEQARSMYRQAREQFDNSYVKAPFDGIVAAIHVKENQTIAMGTPVAQVLSPAAMKAKVQLTGEDIQRISTGQRVIVKFPAIPQAEFEGSVEKINRAVDQITKTLEVEIRVRSNDERIRSGIFGEFFIETRAKPQAMVIPEPALLSQTEILIDRETGLQNTVKKFYVYVVAQGAAKMKEVKTGISNNGRIEIIDGLSAGDSVVVVGQNIVREGRSVAVID